MPVYGGFLISSEEYFRWGKQLLAQQGTPLTEERTQELGTFKALSMVYSVVNSAVDEHKTAIVPVRYTTEAGEEERWIFVTRHRRFTRECFKALGDDHSRLDQFKWGTPEEYALQILNAKGTSAPPFPWKQDF